MNGDVDCVYHPTKDHLDGVPAAIAFPNFLQGDWLAFECRVLLPQGPEHMVNGVQEHSLNPTQVWFLCQVDEVFNKDVYVTKGVASGVQ